MFSNNAEQLSSREDEAILLGVAAHAIQHGLRHGQRLAVDPLKYPAQLRQLRASFVTLEQAGHLRGCIGALEARRPAVVDVASNAYAAAFADPRFPPLQASELPGLHLHISLLSPCEPVTFTSEDDLIAKLRPGVDGLILSEGLRRGTFLPSVWESLPEPREFLRQLKLKAGLPPDYWSERLRVERYATISFGADMADIHAER